MKSVKIILTSLLVLIWILVSSAYFLSTEMTGFYFSQLFFIPLIIGVLLLKRNQELGAITLTFWAILIYGAMNGPYRYIIQVIPFGLLILFLLRYISRTREKELKFIATAVSILALIWALRLLKPDIDFDFILVNQILLVSIPVLLVIHLLGFNESRITDLTKISVLSMAGMILLETVVSTLAYYDLISFTRIATSQISFLTIIVIGITSWILETRNELVNVRNIGLSYLVLILFTEFGMWVLGSINSVI
jgi:hypothetical protein